tara:strand:+ start:362 stop:754 length:393 start_codon:yes stop_codon:yes gene_type:complete
MEDFFEYDGAKDMKDLFESILGSRVNIKDDIANTEEKVFTLFIQKLETQYKIENSILKTSGLEISKLTDNIWFVLESLLKMQYGEEVTSLILWYVLFRNGEEYWGDGEDKIKINTIKRLWKFIQSQTEID